MQRALFIHHAACTIALDIEGQPWMLFISCAAIVSGRALKQEKERAPTSLYKKMKYIMLYRSKGFVIIVHENACVELLKCVFQRCQFYSSRKHFK